MTLATGLTAIIEQGDCLHTGLDDDSVDLVFCSPPYEAARTYGIDFKLKGDAWVEWAVERYLEHLRVCSGLVAWVVEGQTRQFQYSAAPILLMAELHRRGVKLRKPPVFHRVGIPGSGGPDWLRNDYEFIVCGTKRGKLPWSDNTAMGHPPKWAPGGEMSHRLSDGSKVNQWGHSIASGATVVDAGGVVRSKGRRPSHVLMTKEEKRALGGKSLTIRDADKQSNGEARREQVYLPPKLVNPGNVIKRNVGGGQMGSKLAHENEAPFPESLAEFFIKSFCPPGGVVFDPFCGSGTTLKVALANGRLAVGMDIRESQVELSGRRVAEQDCF